MRQSSGSGVVATVCFPLPESVHVDDWLKQASALVEALDADGISCRDNGFRSHPEALAEEGAVCEYQGRQFSLWFDPSPAAIGEVDIVAGQLRAAQLEDVRQLIIARWELLSGSGI